MADIYGNEKSNKLLGTSKADYISAAEGNDTIHGYEGSDVLIGGTGADSLYGGNGDDVIYLGQPGPRYDFHSETAGNYAEGGFGNDSIYGDAGNDTIFANEGNDYIYTGRGNDRVNGNQGNDTIVSSSDSRDYGYNYGSDTLTGGTGTDMFIFTGNQIVIPPYHEVVKEGGASKAIITDFTRGEKIDLSWFETSFKQIDITTKNGDTFIHVEHDFADGKAVLDITLDDFTGVKAADFIF